ncbi:hypothetical protein ABZ626_18300 [Streptomyces longispororuber]|uniref:hypothetical protein n=1 Tax=Streptomyces longispororuber TaxID=68230 RepID=UPI0033C0D563
MGPGDAGRADEDEPPSILYQDKFVFLVVGFPTMLITGAFLPAPISYFFGVFGCLAPTVLYLLLSRVWPQLLTLAAFCGAASALVFLITLWGVLTRSVWWTLLLAAATLFVRFSVAGIIAVRRNRAALTARPRRDGPTAR